MAQRMMWDIIGGEYRGQASNGTVVSVNHETMELAHKKAGKPVYDSDWWVETMEKVLTGWGIHTKRWVDVATRTQRIQCTKEKEPDLPRAPREINVTSPLSSGALNKPVTGSLLDRISGKLTPKDINE